MATETEEEALKAELTAQFEIDGTTLIYDFNKLTMAQMKMAEAVYGYQADLEKKPARSLKEKVQLGGADYDQVVLSHILLKRLPSGELERYKGGETQGKILDLINNMPAGQVAKAEEVIVDFFTRRGKYTLVLLVQRKYDFMHSQNIASMVLAAQEQMNSGKKSSTDNDEREPSTLPENASDESETA